MDLREAESTRVGGRNPISGLRGEPPFSPCRGPHSAAPDRIFRKFPEIENFESRQTPNHGLYHRKLIGYGVFRSIAEVHIEQTRPLDTLWTCVRPIVCVSETEIQYLISVGIPPSVRAEARTVPLRRYWISASDTRTRGLTQVHKVSRGRA